MDSTELALRRVLAFGRAVRPELPAVDEALAALRELLAQAGVAYVVVGGVAVVHHGYVRTTRDIDLLVRAEDATRLEPVLAAGHFSAAGPRRWRHEATGVEIDLRFAGERIPPLAHRTYPEPEATPRSDREPDIVDLAGLLNLKLAAGRHQDLADVVGLVQGLDDASYLRTESAVAADLRARLAALRHDALEERRWRDPGSGMRGAPE